MTPLNRAVQALSDSLSTPGIPLNGDLPTFAVIAVLRAVRPVGAGTREAMARDYIDTILNEGAAPC